MEWVCGCVCAGGGGCSRKGRARDRVAGGRPPRRARAEQCQPRSSSQQLSASRKCGPAPSPSVKHTSHRILGASTPISALACRLKPQLLYIYIYLFIQLLQTLVVACGIFSCRIQNLLPSPRVEPRAPALGAQSPTQWTTREVPIFNILIMESKTYTFDGLFLLFVLFIFFLNKSEVIKNSFAFWHNVNSMRTNN